MENILNTKPEIKENWSKPEVIIFDVAEDTLGTFAGVGSDSGIYS